MRMKFEQGKTNYNEWRATRNDNKKFVARMATINELKEKKALSVYEEMKLVNTVCESEMTGKLTGFYSISTSVLMNPICQARAKNPESICSKCYAANTLAMRDGTMECMETNYIILNTWLISSDAWATLPLRTTNGKYRIESFGDVATVTCCRNYIRIMNTHKHLFFGVWTKNPGLWMTAFELENGKPTNMSFIVSSAYMDKPYIIKESERGIIDHVFTVYKPSTIKERHININCGSRDCNGCRKCYGSHLDIENNYSFHIREKLK